MKSQNTNGEQIKSPLKCEIKTWHLRYDEKGNKIRVAVEDPASDSVPEANLEEYGLVIDREFDKKNNVISTTLTVKAPYILKAFREIKCHHPSVAADFTEPFAIKNPFQMLYHHWEDLDAYWRNLDDDNDDTRMYLNLLFGFMESEFGDSKRSIERQFTSGRCEFQHLWLMFKPGSIVISRFKSYIWLMKVTKTAYQENHRDGKWLEVHCVYTGHNGEITGEARNMIKIFQNKNFAQEHPANIIDLPVFPREYYWAEGQELEQRLRSRGNKFIALNNNMSVQNYDGVAEYLKEIPPGFYHPEESDQWAIWCSYYEKGRAILDVRSFREEHFETTVSTPEDGSVLDTALCPPYVIGYSCSRKTWCRFFVLSIREATWRADPFADVVLPSNQKDLIRALVSSHNFPDDTHNQIEQKGKGLVCLLHGPPGSGKTLTAECAAELTHRALFSCSMSELNKHNTAWYFEKRLAEILRLASAWKAVVLLDEADVFLEARQEDSPAAAERNALVAVFLRHLEYFSGVIFLTTNRIHVFDAAMKSRVHLALGYNQPDQAARRLIWSHNIRQLPQDQVDASIGETLDRLAVEVLNGREISNVVTTASTFARFNVEPLQLRHVETVLGVWRDFETALKGMKSVADLESLENNSPGGVPVGRDSTLG
ncbi:P-loop containing nucleoside triphosphate hydrolase protein [Xylaria castorea]|nr:P-loop containing nucleoside triphosphate hydrolase protein [Xylaria castorea]